MRTWKDHAVSPVLATIMLVAIAVVLAATVYAFASGSRPGERPGSIALVQDGRPLANEQSFAISAASMDLAWGDFTSLLDGRALTYDGALASDGTWCQETPDGFCVATAAFDPDARVQAGQRIRVHDAAIEGAQFQLRDPEANALIASVAIR